MSKERRTVTLESEVNDYLAQDHVNASGLVNDLVKRHMNGDDTDGAIREFRIRQLEEEAEEYASRAERKRSEAQRLKQAAEQRQAEKEGEISDALARLKGVPRDAEHPAVKTQARKVGVEPSELVEQMPENNTDDTADFKSL